MLEVVFIVIAVQKNLKTIIHELRQRGYEVVDIENCSCPIDAVVYRGSIPDMSHISEINMPAPTMGIRSNYGVFLINSQGKNIDELDAMLKARCYSPLFQYT